MNEEEKQKIYNDAIELWGVEAQVMMVIEECGELIQALAQKYRGRGTPLGVAGEVADVQIMTEQMARIIEKGYGQDLVGPMKEGKLKRLSERVEKAKVKIVK